MILALVDDSEWLEALAEAARRDEDVRHGAAEVRIALGSATPRALVVEGDDLETPTRRRARAMGLPVIELPRFAAGEGRRERRVAWLRMSLAGTPATWVDRVLADCERAVGGPLPRPFRTLARRGLEDPMRFQSIEAVGPELGVTPGALRARFRRRGLPSPFWYLRWFRLLAVARLLRERRETTARIAWTMAFHSSGNLARFTRAVCGRRPSELRAVGTQAELLLRFVAEGLRDGQLRAWSSFDDAFERKYRA
jgi:AraC-like DNA-binding protein